MIFAFVFLFHVVFSMLPALLMHHGRTGAADVIYKYYRIMCHQLPHRSWFLFGAQPYYPLNVPEGSDILSIEEAAGFVPGLSEGRSFYGTPEMGYKMAICQRDTAIFAAMALFCLIFALAGKHVFTPHPILLVLFGIVPMALDGGTQLLSRLFPRILPLRESTPLLRTVTGALFGFCLCWYLFPLLEKTLQKGDEV